MDRTITARVVTIITAACVAVIAAEVVARRIDGYKVLSLTLQRTALVSAPEAEPDRKYLPAVLAHGVKPEWYESSPPPSPPAVITPEVAARARKYATTDVNSAFFAWNEVYLRKTLCAGNHGGAFGALDDFFTFEPEDGAQFPAYRHIPHVAPPGAFAPNNFGWRGPEVNATRPARTIRIAFVGASTTIDPYGTPFSHPELVGHWLNMWAQATGLPDRIEVINAARTGIDALSIAAVVRTEVASIDPDLVVYYEGANNFAPAAMLQRPRSIPARPSATFRKRSWAEDYSDLVVRMYDAVLKNGQDGSEPRKPAYRFVWPDGIDERNPDFNRPGFPMPGVVGSLDAIRRSLAESGGEMAIASFVWMVYPGMRLDLNRHLTLFRYLNESYWPATYAEMRRLADFQNVVFRTFAQQHHVAYLPIDENFPRDPDLFGDAIHMTDRGLRLRAWLYLQQLVPIIEAHVSSGAWPKAPATHVPSAAWATTPPKLVPRAAILASCSN
jgi:hypothetical protein